MFIGRENMDETRWRTCYWWYAMNHVSRKAVRTNAENRWSVHIRHAFEARHLVFLLMYSSCLCTALSRSKSISKRTIKPMSVRYQKTSLVNIPSSIHVFLLEPLFFLHQISMGYPNHTLVLSSVALMPREWVTHRRDLLAPSFLITHKTNESHSFRTEIEALEILYGLRCSLSILNSQIRATNKRAFHKIHDHHA